MKLFDTHSHINDKQFRNDVDQVINRAHKAGVSAMMVAGYSLPTSRIALKIAKKNPGCFASVGVHPHNAKEITDKTVEELTDMAKEPEVKALGEFGLDFNRMFSPKDVQEFWFIRQLELADELQLPVIIHERDTEGRLLTLLQQHHNPERQGVIHCYGGTRKELPAYLEMGYYIGVTGIITQGQRGRDLQEMVGMIPTDKLVIETDCPYLTPHPEKKQFRRNEPAFVKSVMLKIASLLGRDPEELARSVWYNSLELYNISEEEL